MQFCYKIVIFVVNGIICYNQAFKWCDWIYDNIETFKSVIGERYPTGTDGKLIFDFKSNEYWEVYVWEATHIESLTTFFEQLIK